MIQWYARTSNRKPFFFIVNLVRWTRFTTKYRQSGRSLAFGVPQDLADNVHLATITARIGVEKYGNVIGFPATVKSVAS